MKGVAPDIETPMPDCRITNPVSMCSGLSAQSEEEPAVCTTLFTFEFPAVAAMPHARLIVGVVALQRPSRHHHWYRVRYTGNWYWYWGGRHHHRPWVAIVVVYVVSDSDHDVARRVMHRLTARA